MSAKHTCAWCQWRIEGGINPLEQGLYTAVSYHVGAENQTQVFWKIECTLDH